MRKVGLYIFLGLTAAIIALILWRDVWGINITVEQVHHLIETNVAKGATESEVIAFISSLKTNSLRTESYGYQEDLSGLDLEQGIFDEKNNKLRGALKGYLDAKIFDSESSPISYCNIRIRFYFDRNGQMVDYGIRRECDSL
jgi:hypothetical protein